jgi:hypothetical protein
MFDACVVRKVRNIADGKQHGVGAQAGRDDAAIGETEGSGGPGGAGP